MGEKLNLGCGDDYRAGWVNADVRPAVDPDVVVDLDCLPLPFADDAFGEILLDNVLEHVDDQYAVLRELHRVAAAGATMTFRGPHWHSPGAWIDPTHTRPFSRRTFEHYLVADLFDVETVSATRVRMGRLLPERVALALGDHVGHLVSEIEVTVSVLK
mgnify:CR=1 FL=1